jgi:hypothetical protein
MLRTALRRHVDPTHSRDPRVRALVADLAALPIAPEPDAQFRADLRAQLVAITPRLVAEAAADTGRSGSTATLTRTTAAPAAARTDREPSGRSRRRISLGRPLAVTASVLVVLTLLLGGAVWMSRKALPGDSLYGLKRAGERIQLSTASNDRDKAQDYLDFAATRATEVRALWSRSTSTALGSRAVAAGRPSSQARQLIVEALDSSDSDVRSASRLLTAEAVRSHSAAPLDTMTDWTPAQQARLRALAAALPAGALRTHATSSAALVAAARKRATLLGADVHCSCLSGATTDSLGPKPCTPCTTPAQSPTQQTPVRAPTGSVSSGAKKAPGSTSSRAPHSARGSTSGTGGSTRSVHVGTPSVPKVTLPQLPVLPKTGKPSIPGVHVGSCGVSASPLGIGVGVGLCPPGVTVSLHK